MVLIGPITGLSDVRVRAWCEKRADLGLNNEGVDRENCFRSYAVRVARQLGKTKRSLDLYRSQL